MDEYLTEKTPQKIFVESGFNEEVIGIKQMEQQSACSWKKAYEKNGLCGLTDIRKKEPGRTLKRELTPSEVIERQNARIKHLDGKVELLKKLESKERRLLNTRENLCPSKAYQLIQETIELEGFKRMARYFCDLLEVSRSAYYSYFKYSTTREAREQLLFENERSHLRTI